MKVTFHAIDPSKLKTPTLTIKNKISNLSSLIQILRTDYKMDNIFENNELPPGMLCMINKVDYECLNGELKIDDDVVFINSLHGG